MRISKFSAALGRLRERVEALPLGNKVVVDEIQKLPILLDEIQSMIFDFKERYQFELTGSSSRKLKKSKANMLAGRALQRRKDYLLGKDRLKIGKIQILRLNEFCKLLNRDQLL